MKAVGLAQLVLFVTSLSLITASQGACPPWFFPDTDNGTECVCSSYETATVVKCSKGTALLRIGVCMTYNNETRDTEIGPCPYILKRSNFSSGNHYFHLQKHTSNLTSFMCGPLHRKGLLCGECEDGFGPALYSYTLECKQCWGHGLGWLLYITLTIISTNSFVHHCCNFPCQCYFSAIKCLRAFLSYHSVYLSLTVWLILVCWRCIEAIFTWVAERDASTLWIMESRLFPSHSSSILCKPKLDKPTCICTGVHWGFLSSDSYTDYIHLH